MIVLIIMLNSDRCLFGPFQTRGEAIAWAKKMAPAGKYWTTETLYNPKKVLSVTITSTGADEIILKDE